MKKLDKKAFWTILAGIISTVIYKFVDMVLNKNRQFPALENRLNQQQLERLSTALFRLNLIGTIILTIVCAYFVYRLIKNSTQPQGQKYITFLYVTSIIFAVFNILSILFGNWQAAISVALNMVILVGCKTQKNY